MKRFVVGFPFAACLCFASTHAIAHDCRVVGNGYLRGHYEGECNEKDEIAHGQGEATGAEQNQH